MGQRVLDYSHLQAVVEMPLRPVVRDKDMAMCILPFYFETLSGQVSLKVIESMGRSFIDLQDNFPGIRGRIR